VSIFASKSFVLIFLLGYGVLLLALIGWTVQGWPRDLRRFK
jgi:hypothetical protein